MRGGARGSVYAAVLGICAALGMAVAATLLLSQTRTRHATLAIAQRVAQSQGEAACEAAANELLAAMADFDYARIPAPGGDPMPVEVVVGGRVVSCTVSAADVDQVVDEDEEGIRTILAQYEIEADAESTEGTTERVRALYQVAATPIFQFAVFYGGDLEVLPAPSMTLSGRVHSNRDMYLGTHNGSPGFVLDTGYVRASGKIRRRRKDDGATMAGTVYADDGDGSPVTWPSGMDSDSETWFQDAMDRWDGVVRSDVHGVTPLAVPTVGSIAPGGHYDAKAEEGGIQILDDAILVGGVDVTGAFNALAGGTVVTSTAVYDRREARTGQVYDVNVSRLNAAIDAYFGSGSHPASFNGVLYMRNTALAVGNPDGFQLSSAGTLIQGNGGNAVGLTVVTDGPVYLKGDVNAVGKKPMAVIADAVNLLSNAWDNTKTPGGGLPAASDTTYHFAMISGNVETPDGGGAYSGGLENLPRFHENWSGKTATFRGSFVCLGESQYATGAWAYGPPWYLPPNRNWNYDIDFNDVNNLPPETPMVWGIRRIVYGDDEVG